MKDKERIKEEGNRLRIVGGKNRVEVKGKRTKGGRDGANDKTKAR